MRDFILFSCSLILVVTFSLAAQGDAPIESATITSKVAICGLVYSYTPATARVAGLLTIWGRSLEIAPGTRIEDSDGLRPGADFCIAGSLDADGRLVEPTSVYLNPYMEISVCGFVTAFEAASSSNDGSLTIDDRILRIASGTTIQNSDSMLPSVHVCLRATADARGMIIAPSSVRVTPAWSFPICGVITAFDAPTGDSTGIIVIGGTTYKIAAGASVEGELRDKLCVCLDVSQAIGGELLRMAVRTDDHPPVMSVPADQSVVGGKTLRFSVFASDPDPCDTVTITASGIPENVSFLLASGNPAWGELVLDSTHTWLNGSYVVRFTATDQRGETDTREVTIHVGSSGPTNVPTRRRPVSR